MLNELKSEPFSIQYDHHTMITYSNYLVKWKVYKTKLLKFVDSTSPVF